MKPVKVMGVPINPVTNQQMESLISEMLSEKTTSTLMTPNPEMVMAATTNSELMAALQSADLVIPDGIGLIIASRLKNLGLKERVTGIDTMEKVLACCHQQQLSFFLLGGQPGRAEKAVNTIEQKYPGIKVAGCHHGYFQDAEEKGVLEMIRNSSPDVLFVCLGFPRQEIWINQNRSRVSSRLMMGVGGSVDVYAGEVKRAPVFFQKLGIEWLYRLLQEPSRLGRMSVLPVFLWKALWIQKDEMKDR
ncbi:WecB/TagA/CpsF family glycosyltransferase [Anoxynatronum sibiricum]|uniref:N-acetylglucosaminyldiphosphoundecaprenol N-acetyl-beta-D-mannosaminyltransferase n=1 Tax=Anoxynatronum sibiricum TaxID=210623 RepID=A0ABU9VPM4_9CLOT